MSGKPVSVSTLAMALNATSVRPGEWKALCPNHDDRSPSLTICERGKDGRPFLYCLVCGDNKVAEVYKSVEAVTGMILEGRLDAKYTKAKTIPQASIVPVPDSAPRFDPSKAVSFGNGKSYVPDAVYEYRDYLGDLWFYVVRKNACEETEGKKLLVQQTVQANDFGNLIWKTGLGGLGIGRPLFGAHLLAANPDADILIVEGEKAATRAREFERFKNKVVLSWQGGTSAWRKSDWSVLSGRRVLLWPDNDAVGKKAMEEIAMHLAKDVKASTIGLVSIPTHLPDGWDVGDAGDDFDFTGFDSVSFSYDAHADWTSKFQVYGKHETPYGNDYNIKVILTYDPKIRNKIRWDEFALKILVSSELPWDEERQISATYPREWTESDFTRFKMYCSEYGVRPTSNDVNNVVIEHAECFTVNPVKEYMDRIEWDGVERLSHFPEEYLGADASNVNRVLFRKCLISVVARTYQPGCQADHVLILEGAQGIGKSSLCRLLAVKPEWFAHASMELHNKDAIIGLQGKLILEMAELTSIKKSDVETVKTYLTTVSDHIRLPYGKRSVDLPRRSVFIGTTNEDTYLKDSTGNRRFWPIRCRQILLTDVAEIVEQLWAEAVAAYRNGEAWHITDPTLLEELRELRDERLEVDGLHDEIEAVLSNGGLVDPDITTTKEIITRMFPNDPGKWSDRYLATNIGKYLRGKNWYRVQVVRSKIKWNGQLGAQVWALVRPGSKYYGCRGSELPSYGRQVESPLDGDCPF